MIKTFGLSFEYATTLEMPIDSEIIDIIKSEYTLSKVDMSVIIPVLIVKVSNRSAKEKIKIRALKANKEYRHIRNIKDFEYIGSISDYIRPNLEETPIYSFFKEPL